MTDSELRLECLKMALYHKEHSVIDRTMAGGRNLDRIVLANRWFNWVKNGEAPPSEPLTVTCGSGGSGSAVA